MRTIGMINGPEKAAETQAVEVAETKAEMIEAAEAAGIELTPAEKRLSKEKLAEAIARKQE